jgi:hypothetical protein
MAKTYKKWITAQMLSRKHGKLPHTLRILHLLSDKKYHSVLELHKICWRYGARLHELRKDGHTFIKRKDKNNNLEEWKLTSNLPKA